MAGSVTIDDEVTRMAKEKETKICPFLTIAATVAGSSGAPDAVKRLGFKKLLQQACVRDRCQIWWFCRGTKIPASGG